MGCAIVGACPPGGRGEEKRAARPKRQRIERLLALQLPRPSMTDLPVFHMDLRPPSSFLQVKDSRFSRGLEELDDVREPEGLQVSGNLGLRCRGGVLSRRRQAMRRQCGQVGPMLRVAAGQTLQAGSREKRHFNRGARTHRDG